MSLVMQNRLKDEFLKLTSPKAVGFEAIAGDGNGNIEVSGREEYWYVRPIGSALPMVVKRGAAPKIEGIRVRVEYEYQGKRKGKLRITGVTSVSSTGDDSGSYPGLLQHAETHLAGAIDPVYIDTLQILNGLAYASQAAGMTVKVNPGWARITDTLVRWELQTIDLTSSIPETGALMAVIRADIDGAFDVQVGDEVDSYLDLAWTDIPQIDYGYAPIAVIKLYAGQTALSRLRSNPDVYDVRFAPVAASQVDWDDILSLPDPVDENAIHVDVDSEIYGLDLKASPADDDVVVIEDSEASYAKKKVKVSELGGGGGGGGDDLFWYVDGALAAETDVGMTVVASRSMTISKVIVHLKEPGSAGSTIIDLNINGSSIFTSEPELAYDDADNIVSATPDTTSISADDVITLDIDQAAADAESLTVCMAVSY